VVSLWDKRIEARVSSAKFARFFPSVLRQRVIGSRDGRKITNGSEHYKRSTQSVERLTSVHVRQPKYCVSLGITAFDPDPSA
jgi:hypothetical protein